MSAKAIQRLALDATGASRLRIAEDAAMPVKCQSGRWRPKIGSSLYSRSSQPRLTRGSMKVMPGSLGRGTSIVAGEPQTPSAAA